MSATTFLAIIIGIWIVIGIATAIVMGRRGHRPYTWVLLGAFLGPLVVVPALEAIGSESGASESRPTTRKQGRLSLLVGLDGWAESRAALAQALHLFAGAGPRVTMVEILDFEREIDETTHPGHELRDDVIAATERAPELVALLGDPAERLKSLARSDDFHAIVIGRRGRGATKMVMGSGAAALTAGSPIPVLVGGGTVAPAKGWGRTARAGVA